MLPLEGMLTHSLLGPIGSIEERDPATAVIRQLSNALQKLQPNMSNKPDYRGIDKPKLDVFSGDASVYAHWKKKFLLLHGPERNLDDAYLANALHCLLTGEARRKVEVHFTADWNGDNYQRMWDTLDDPNTYKIVAFKTELQGSFRLTKRTLTRYLRSATRSRFRLTII